MMPKIKNKHCNVLQIKLKLQETFQNNLFLAFKRTKTCKKLYEVISKMNESVQNLFKKQKRKM